MAQGFMMRIAADVRREIAAAVRLDGQLTDRDIAARRHEAAGGRLWAKQRERIQRELEKIGASESEWCKRELDCDITTMRRRVQLAKHWNEYERKRREEGCNGQFGLIYGLSLIRTEATTHATNAQAMRIRSVSAVPTLDISKCQFITGDALAELTKLKPKSVSCILTSPPYWPIKCAYGGQGIGLEATPAEYIADIVSVMNEARRVMKDDGTLWIVVGDSYSQSAGAWTPFTHSRKGHGPQKQKMADGTVIQGGDRPTGNLLMIPARLAIALQDDDWILRQAIVWDKVWAQPESVKNRATQTYEMIFMFVKKSGYFYDQDPLRIPSPSKHFRAGNRKSGVVRRDANRTDLRVQNNPLGHNAPSVWQIRHGGYPGEHPATFPPELARRIIVTACDTNSLVLDPFGGAGTTAMVALQHGHRATTIDLNGEYTQEAIERLSKAPAICEANEDAPAPMELAAE